MREKNEKNMHETETAFALSVLLLNILIVIIMCTAVWLISTALTENNGFRAILYGDILH